MDILRTETTVYLTRFVERGYVVFASVVGRVCVCVCVCACVCACMCVCAYQPYRHPKHGFVGGAPTFSGIAPWGMKGQAPCTYRSGLGLGYVFTISSFEFVHCNFEIVIANLYLNFAQIRGTHYMIVLEHSRKKKYTWDFPLDARVYQCARPETTHAPDGFKCSGVHTEETTGSRTRTMCKADHQPVMKKDTLLDNGFEALLAEAFVEG